MFKQHSYSFLRNNQRPWVLPAGDVTLALFVIGLVSSFLLTVIFVWNCCKMARQRRRLLAYSDGHVSMIEVCPCNSLLHTVVHH